MSYFFCNNNDGCIFSVVDDDECSDEDDDDDLGRRSSRRSSTRKQISYCEDSDQSQSWNSDYSETKGSPISKRKRVGRRDFSKSSSRKRLSGRRRRGSVESGSDFDPDDSDEHTKGSKSRRASARKVNYRDMLGASSEEDLPKKKKKGKLDVKSFYQTDSEKSSSSSSDDDDEEDEEEAAANTRKKLVRSKRKIESSCDSSETDEKVKRTESDSESQKVNGHGESSPPAKTDASEHKDTKPNSKFTIDNLLKNGKDPREDDTLSDVEDLVDFVVLG